MSLFPELPPQINPTLPPDRGLIPELPLRLDGTRGGIDVLPAFLIPGPRTTAEPIMPPSNDRPNINFLADVWNPAAQAALALTAGRIGYRGMPDDIGLAAAQIFAVCMTTSAGIRAFEAGTNLIEYARQRSRR
jgi:hypothetical protein